MKSCNCPECVDACRNDPGRLVPGDISKLGGFLGIDEVELVKNYLVKIPFSKNVYALAPAKLKGKRFLIQPGGVTPDYYAGERGSCIFLDGAGLCKVHSVKPFECAAYMGCKNTFLGKPYKERQVEEYFFLHWKKFKINV
jgi:Fe-S-cluster containining protein